jgi:hypothetical protein
VFQNPDASRHHFQLLVLLVHDQLQSGGGRCVSRDPWVVGRLTHPRATRTHLLGGLLLLSVSRGGRYQAGIQ